MSRDKVTFTARDLTTPAAQKDAAGKTSYNGPNRRVTSRRSGSDRRADVRFEVDSSDRRSNHGRRRGDPAPKPW